MSHKIALNSLDFRDHQSVTVAQQLRANGMNSTVINEAIKVCLSDVHSCLSEAARIARAPEACVNAGSVTEAVTISMDIEQLIYEAGRLQDAASLLNRVSQA